MSNSSGKLSIDEKTKGKQNVEPITSFTDENIGKNEVLTSFRSADGKIVNITGDVDEAMKLAVNLNDIKIDEKADKKLLLKIDICLLPLLCLLYAFQFMDKISNSYAAVMGFREYFGMVGNMYSWCGTAFYLGYLFFEFPSNMLIQRFPLAKTASIFIVLWGMILCLHSSCKSYAAIITLRVILGMLESIVTPTMVLLTSQWWKKEEQFFRTTIWFACNGVGTMLGGAIAYGLAKHKDQISFPAWKVLYLVDGLMTIAIGFIFFLHVPDNPSKAWFLTKKEKEMVVLRIKDNQQGFGNKHFKWYQFKEAICDWQIILYVIFGCVSNIPNGSLTNFSSILLNTNFGYDEYDSLLMNMPAGAVEFVGCILIVAIGIKLPMLSVSFFSMVVGLVASCMLAFSSNKEVKLAGYYLISIYALPMICNLACFSANTAGHTKKITADALYLISYCVGNLIGPQTFIASQAPGYSGGKITIVVCNSISVVIIAVNWFIYWNRNRVRDKKGNEEATAILSHVENFEFADLTDKENPYFRYTL